jgi:acyl-CoA thioesterase I
MACVTIWILKHVAGGGAFFTGAALLLLAVIWQWKRSPGGQPGVTVLWTIGLVLILFSATPLSWGYYVLAGTVSVVWLMTGKSRPAENRPLVRRMRAWDMLFVAVWAGGVLWEIPFHLMPRLSPAAAPRLTVIGDSVTAGLGDGALRTWPELLRQREGLDIVDLSEPGANVATALRRVRDETPLPGIVLIEIGGNDLLGETSAADFERGLDELLRQLHGEGRQLVMFELPLPPLENRFGQVQRRLAREHDVALIPKRVFLEVLLSSETTLDSIHLNQAGHEAMARIVWELIGPAIELSVE